MVYRNSADRIKPVARCSAISIMAPVQKEKRSYVTPDGRTIVDTNKLLRDPKVQEALEKMSKRKFIKFKGRVLKKVNSHA